MQNPLVGIFGRWGKKPGCAYPSISSTATNNAKINDIFGFLHRNFVLH